MFSSPHRHTQPRESQTVISQQSERNEKKGFGFCFCFHGRGLKTISITSCNFSPLA